MSCCHRWAVVRKTRSSATLSQLSGYGRPGSEWFGCAREGVTREMISSAGEGGQGWWGRKPSSVRARLSAGRSSIWDGGHPPPQAAYPRLERPGPGLAAYLALLRLGVAVPRLLPAVRWALTPPFHPYPPANRWAVCFLLPFPSPRGAQGLPGSLPCGARTFLGPPRRAATVTPHHPSVKLVPRPRPPLGPSPAARCSKRRRG